MIYFRDLIITSLLLYCLLLILNVMSHQFVSALLPLTALGWLNVLFIGAYLGLQELKHWNRTH